MGGLTQMALEQKVVSELVFVARGYVVIMDEDLARLFGTTTKALNQQIKRNLERFEERFVFQLTPEEWSQLKSQSVTASAKHGGRRTPPWVFTEHGIPMAATVVHSPRAVEATKLIIDVFVDARHQMLSGASGTKLMSAQKQRGDERRKVQDLIVQMASTLINAQINQRDGTSVRQEVELLTTSVLDNVKAQLASKVIQNEETIAEIHRKLAEAEKLRAEARKTDAEARKTDAEAKSVDLKNMRELLDMLKSIEKTLDQEDVTPVLEAMSAVAVDPANYAKLIDITPKASKDK